MLQGEKGYYVIMVADRKAPYLPALKEIEPEVEKQYREAEAKRLAQKEAETLLARLKKGDSLEAVAREKGLKITETGLFQPGGAVPKLGSSPELTEALFQISEKNPYPEQVLSDRGELRDHPVQGEGQARRYGVRRPEGCHREIPGKDKRRARSSRPGSRGARPP